MGQTTINPLGRIANSSIGNKFKYDPDTTTGLNFGYQGGRYQADGNEVTVPAGTVTLIDNETNIIQMSLGGDITAVAQGNEGVFILYKVVTSGGAITTITDLRSTYAQ